MRAARGQSKHPQCQSAGGWSEFLQGAVAACVAVAAGSAGKRDGFGRRSLTGEELPGQIPCGQPEHDGAVAEIVRSGCEVAAGARVVTDTCAVHEQVVMEDVLSADRDRRGRVAVVVGGDK